MEHKFNIGDVVQVLNGPGIGLLGVVKDYHYVTVDGHKVVKYIIKHNGNVVPDELYLGNDIRLWEFAYIIS